MNKELGMSSSRRVVIVADPIDPAGLQHLRENFKVIEFGGEQSGATDARLQQADGLVVRTYRTCARVMDLAPSLKIVVKHGSGVDNIDIPAATERNILVANTPGGANSTSVAEGAVALMLAVGRRIRDLDCLVRTGRFNERWTIRLQDLYGKTLGLVGFGQIGKVTAKICHHGFDMTVLAYDPNVDAAAMAGQGVTKVERLEDLLGASDVVSVHVALMPGKTYHLIDAGALSRMQPHAILINTSRGGVVDEAALADALAHGRIAGAGLDVFENEPPEASNPLLQRDDVVLSPHVAGVTNDSLRHMALSVAKMVTSYFIDDIKPATLLNPSGWESRRK